MTGLEDVFGVGARRPTPQVTGPQEGIVIGVDPGTGGVMFRVPAFSEAAVFGPAKWTRPGVEPHSVDGHDHDGTAPAAGQTCLVVFVGPGIERPWVVAWW